MSGVLKAKNTKFKSKELISDSDASEDDQAVRSESPNKRRKVASEEQKEPHGTVPKLAIPKDGKEKAVKRPKKAAVKQTTAPSAKVFLSEVPAIQPPTKPVQSIVVTAANATQLSQRMNSDVDSEEESSEGEAEPQTFDYHPPRGFSALPITSPSTPFSSTSLNGKQLFFFSAPSSLNLLKDAHKFNLHPGPDGEPFVLKNATDRSFTFRRDEDVGISLLTPREGKSGYKLANIQTAAHFFISETAPTERFNAIPRRNYTKPRRAQPEGLKMRFKPSGWGEDDGNTDNEDVDTSMVDSQATDVKEIQANGSEDHEGETKEERKARREQKRLEKEAKRRRKEKAKAT